MNFRLKWSVFVCYKWCFFVRVLVLHCIASDLVLEIFKRDKMWETICISFPILNSAGESSPPRPVIYACARQTSLRCSTAHLLPANVSFIILLHIGTIYNSTKPVPSFNKCSAVAEMGDRLATIDMGRKLGVPLWGGELGPHLTQFGLGRGLPPYQMASWSIQPFGHNTPTLQTDGQTTVR